MSLVAYASSESDDDTSQDEASASSKSKTTLNQKLENKKSGTKKPVQIVLPSLDQVGSDSDDDRPLPNGPKVATKPGERCGLFSVLPPPSTATQLVPHVLNKKPAAATRNNLVLPPAKSTVSSSPSVSQSTSTHVPSAASSVASSLDDYTDAEHDDVSASYFFSSSNSPTSKKTFQVADVACRPVQSVVELAVVNSEVDGSQQHTVNQFEANVSQLQVDEHHVRADNIAAYDNFEPTASSSTSLDNYLQDEQFLRLCGRKRHLKEPVDIVDIHADDQLQDVDLTKAITEEVGTVMSHSKKRNKDMPSSQQKRKHQITFLAYKAKERELELKNQWSENKFNKRQTQSKYGF